MEEFINEMKIENMIYEIRGKQVMLEVIWLNYISVKMVQNQ